MPHLVVAHVYQREGPWGANPALGWSRLPIDKDKFHIGRDPAADLRLELPAVARREAWIIREGDFFYLEALESRNATCFKRQILRTLPRQVLSEGDLIRVCDYVFRFQWTEGRDESYHRADRLRRAADAVALAFRQFLAPALDPNRPRHAQFFTLVCPICKHREEIGLWYPYKVCAGCHRGLQIVRGIDETEGRQG